MDTEAICQQITPTRGQFPMNMVAEIFEIVKRMKLGKIAQ